MAEKRHHLALEVRHIGRNGAIHIAVFIHASVGHTDGPGSSTSARPKTVCSGVDGLVSTPSRDTVSNFV